MPEGDLNEQYQQATVRTAGDLLTIAKTMHMDGSISSLLNSDSLSDLELPEIEWLAQEVARVVPAGNVPGLILSSLTSLKGRQIAANDSRKHLDTLFIGVRQSLDRAITSTLFGGPAAVLYGYQQLLRLAGKDIDEAFSDGTWQYYLEFALREDSARHANETTGFQAALGQLNLQPGDADMLAAWMFAVKNMIEQLDDILANEWRERAILKSLGEVAEATNHKRTSEYQKLFSVWERQRPYKNALFGQINYAAYRRRIFDHFWKPYYEAFNNRQREQFDALLAQREQVELALYIQQMTWLAYLDPTNFREVRTPYPFSEARLGVISNGHYYLVKLSEFASVDQARSLAHAIMHDSKKQPVNDGPGLDEVLMGVRRAEQTDIRRRLDKDVKADLEQMRYAPVIINWDKQDVKKPLSQIRRGKRGFGDHALTIFRTQESFVFDQSHIFFDGAWGAVIAQVLTHEAVDWAEQIGKQENTMTLSKAPYRPKMIAAPAVIKQADKSSGNFAEASAENVNVDLKTIISLRKLLKKRTDLMSITVNDLFILYRGLHVQGYTPSDQVLRLIDTLDKNRSAKYKQASQAAQEAIKTLKNTNPSILIPIDASRNLPRDRVFPTTFRNPLVHHLYNNHRETIAALIAYESATGRDKSRKYEAFKESQLTYLRVISGFGELLSKYKEIALSGQSPSNTSLKYLAYLPASVQKVLDDLPNRFNVMNEVIKGQEVFSNIGRVVPGSSLSRFITAKDDNEHKTLMWGVLTDTNGRVYMSLRDFRPHVEALHEIEQYDLADMIVQDYLDSYVDGLNRYVSELRRIASTSASSQDDNRNPLRFLWGQRD